MYKQSNEAKLAYQSAERTLDIVVNVNGVDYKATDIEQFDYDSGGYTGDTFSIGSTYENNITVKFIHLVEGLKRGMIVKPRIGIKLPNGTFEYTPLGVFIIADEIQMDRNNNSTTIKAYDKFVVMEGQYVSKLTYPANAVDIITEIAQMCKVDVNTNDLAHLPTIKVSKAITKQSYRTAIGWIAQLYVGFASFDRDGKLTIRRVAEPNYTIEPSEYEQQGLVKNEAPYIIGGISCNVNVVETTNNGETNEATHKLHSGSVNGSQIELTNDIMTQELLDSIWNSLKTVTFYPFSLNWFGNPAIEAGDWLSLKDMKGNVFVVPNNGYTISFNGGLSSTSKADQNATDSSTVKYTGELTRAIENYSRRQAPDGTNIYTDVKEPTDAKFNDVWFKPNGNSTELWIFERQSDGTGKWVKQPVNGEVEQKINDALKDFDELDKSFKDNASTQSATNELMKSRIDSISNQIPNLSDEISRVNGSVTSLKTQTDKDRQQLQTTSQNLDKARQDVLSNSSRIDKLSVGLDSVNINVNNVNSKVDNIKVGGTNLLKDSSVPLTASDVWIADGVSNEIVNDYVRMRGTGDSNRIRQTFSNNGLNADGYYSISFWASNDGNDEEFDVQVGTWSSLQTVHITGSFKLYKLENVWLGGSPVFSFVAPFNKVVRLKKIKLEKGTIATDWSPAPEDEIERVSQLKVDLNGMNATVATNKGDIAQIKLTENGMQQSIKDAQGNISTLQNDSKQFKQQFQDVNGNITTIKNDAKSLSSQLSTKVGTSEYNSFKEQTAQELRTKLTASDLSGYAKSADVKVSVDGLNARFDNLNVGGTNLLKNSLVPLTASGVWINDGVSNQIVDDYVRISGISNNNRIYQPFSNNGLNADGYYSISFWASNDGNDEEFDVQVGTWNSLQTVHVTGSFKLYKLENVWLGGNPSFSFVAPFNKIVRLKKLKLEKGTIATDWSPAPEDLATKLQLNQVIDTADSHTRTISDYLTGSNSRFTQLSNNVNLKVNKGDVIGQINLEAGRTLLQNQKIYLDADTVGFSGKAFIPSAAIKDLDAGKITTGTLDAANVNVINLNANNITSGSIKGTNLDINLNSGNVSFQKGRIHDSNNYVDINIDQRYISTSNLFTRVILKDGKMQLMDKKLFDITNDYYFEISNEGKGGTQWLTGATLLGKNSVFLGTKNGAANGSVTEASPMGQTKSSGISVDDYQPTLITGSSRGVMIKGGETFRLATGDTTPYISVGTGQGGISKNRIIIDADYVHFPSVNLKTTSSSPNVYVANDGALVRSTSAAKYKTDIVRSHDLDYGNKILNVPIATWIDKAEAERYAKKESEQEPVRHFGMIADDLANAGLELLITRNNDGELEGIQYDRIAPALIPVISNLKTRLELLERKLLNE